MNLETKTRIAVAAVCLSIFVGVTGRGVRTAAAAEDKAAEQVIVVQIRRQGYACKHPEKATRDKKHSRPNRAVWVLKCESGTYRVRLVPDMAAQVERLD
jgi:hypothetical protein